jgi:WD40 repeat protein
MTIIRTNTLDIHKKKVNALKIDNMRRLLFTGGEDRKLNVIDYETLKVVGSLKTTNARLRALAINEDLKRLYASSCEGQLFIFNIAVATPLLMKSFTFG